MTFREALRHNSTSLTSFSGREALASFWFYVAAVIGTTMLVTVGGMMLLLRRTFGKMQQFAALHPDETTVSQGPGSYSIQIHGAHPELMPPFVPVVLVWAIITAVVVLLLAAAVVRRLHDSNLRGGRGLIPLPFLFFGFGAMAHQFARFGQGSEPHFGWFFVIFFNNLIYLALLLTLVILLARGSTPGPNRFGAPSGESES